MAEKPRDAVVTFYTYRLSKCTASGIARSSQRQRGFLLYVWYLW